MASTDAKPVPIKNTAYRVTFPIFDADGDLVTGATGLDSEVSKDGGTFADCTNEATEIATSSGMYYLDLTSTEMNADTVAVIVKTSSSGAKTTPLVMYPQEAGDIKIDVESISGDSTAADNLEAACDGTGYNVGAGAITVDVTKISGDATAADNLEAACDGTGYNVGGGSITADAVKIGGSTTAATRLGQFSAAVRRITVDDSTFTPTTTAVETSATVDEESAYLNQCIFFESTGITRVVTTYAFTNSKVKLTFAALPSAPANGAAIQIMGKFGSS